MGRFLKPERTSFRIVCPQNNNEFQRWTRLHHVTFLYGCISCSYYLRIISVFCCANRSTKLFLVINYVDLHKYVVFISEQFIYNKLLPVLKEYNFYYFIWHRLFKLRNSLLGLHFMLSNLLRSNSSSISDLKSISITSLS